MSARRKHAAIRHANERADREASSRALASFQRDVTLAAAQVLQDRLQAILAVTQRALLAWDTTTLKASGDGMMQEAMEDLRAEFDTLTGSPKNHTPQSDTPPR